MLNQFCCNTCNTNDKEFWFCRENKEFDHFKPANKDLPLLINISSAELQTDLKSSYSDQSGQDQ